MNFNRVQVRGHKLNLTPMIDVVFLLIIFFMVISKFSSQERALIDLAPAKDADTKTVATEQQKIIINIQKSGEIWIDNQVYSSLEMQKLLSAHKDDKVIIRSDKNCNWKQVRPIFNTCREAGIATPDIAVMKE